MPQQTISDYFASFLFYFLLVTSLLSVSVIGSLLGFWLLVSPFWESLLRYLSLSWLILNLTRFFLVTVTRCYFAQRSWSFHLTWMSSVEWLGLQLGLFLFPFDLIACLGFFLVEKTPPWSWKIMVMLICLVTTGVLIFILLLMFMIYLHLRFKGHEQEKEEVELEELMTED